jgi:phosphopantetheinyl transferase
MSDALRQLWTLVYGDYGKPYLASHTLHFNLSHAQHRLAIAVSTSFAVGIDIEYHKPLSRFEALCQRCLTPTEQKNSRNWIHYRPGIGFSTIGPAKKLI